MQIENKKPIFSVSLSDKECTQGYQLYDINYENKIIGTHSMHQLKKYIDISEVEKEGIVEYNIKYLSTLLNHLTKGDK